MRAFSVLNYGGPDFYSYVSEKLQKRIGEIRATTLAELCEYFRRASNSAKGGFGFFAAVEKELRVRMNSRELSFSDASKVAESLFTANVGSNEF